MIKYKNYQKRRIKYQLLDFQGRIILETENQDMRDREFDIRRLRGEPVEIRTINY